MNIFILNLDLKISAGQLDKRRCGKQRLECADALAMLLGQPAWMSDKQYAYIQKKYRHHPAWQMWKGFEPALIEYGLVICREWIDRGCKDTFLQKIGKFADLLEGTAYFDWELADFENPPWLTGEFCSNHRSIMLGKIKEAILNTSYARAHDFDGSLRRFKEAKKVQEWYQQWGWTERPAKRIEVNGRMVWPYIWPEAIV